MSNAPLKEPKRGSQESPNYNAISSSSNSVPKEEELEYLVDYYDDESPDPDFKVKKSYFYRNIFCITYSTLFCIEFSRGLFMASTYGAVKHCRGDLQVKTLLGIVVASFSVGRLVASLVLGYLSDKMSEKYVLLLASTISMIASILYIVAYEHRLHYLLILARILHGIGAGVLSVVRSHTSKITTVKQRTGYMALNGAAQYAALGIAPFVAIALSNNETDKHRLFNGFTAPAFILMITNIVNIFLLVFVFVTIKKEHIRQEKTVTDTVNNDDPKWNKIVLVGIFIYIFFNFASRSVFALIETVATPLYADQRHIGEDDPLHRDQLVNRASGLLFGYLGLGGLVMFGATIILTKFVNEDKLLGIAFLIIAAGSFLLMIGGQQSLGVLLAGLILIWSIAFPLKQTTIMSSFSKILGGKPQGAMMGWIGTIGSLGRIVMPLLTALITYEVSFLLGALISLLSAALLGAYIYVVHRYQAQHQSYSAI